MKKSTAETIAYALKKECQRNMTAMNLVRQSLVILHGDVLLKMLMEWQYKHLKSKFLRNRYILQI